MGKDKVPCHIPKGPHAWTAPASPGAGGRRSISGCRVASAKMSAPRVFVGLTFSFCEMGTNLSLWQAAVRELAQN